MADDFDREGYLVVRAAVPLEVVAAALSHLAELQADQPDTPIVTASLERDPFLAALAERRDLAGVAAALLGGPVIAFGATYLVKPPRIGLPTLWHQDGHPWREILGGAPAVTLWVALDDATIANGCMRVVPGSHHEPARPLRPNTDTPSLFGAEIDPSAVDVSRAVPLELAAGDLSAHHPNLIHGSDANRSDTPRRALAIRYRASSSSRRS